MPSVTKKPATEATSTPAPTQAKSAAVKKPTKTVATTTKPSATATVAATAVVAQAVAKVSISGSYNGPKFIKLICFPDERKSGSKDLDLFKAAFVEWVKEFEDETFSRKDRTTEKMVRYALNKLPVNFYVAKNIATFERVWYEITTKVKAAEDGRAPPQFHAVVIRGVEHIDDSQAWFKRAEIIDDSYFVEIMENYTTKPAGQAL